MLTYSQECYNKPRQCVQKQRHHFTGKGPYSQDYGLFSSHVQLWELDQKEGKALKNWFLQTVVLDKTFESPLNSKEIKPINLKGSQPWIVIRRTDAETGDTFWSPDMNSWLIGKDLMLGKIESRRRRVLDDKVEDKMAGLHHWCNGDELGQTLRDGEG